MGYYLDPAPASGRRVAHTGRTSLSAVPMLPVPGGRAFLHLRHTESTEVLEISFASANSVCSAMKSPANHKREH
jgi:hypothetical protein